MYRRFIESDANKQLKTTLHPPPLLKKSRHKRKVKLNIFGNISAVAKRLNHVGCE